MMGDGRGGRAFWINFKRVVNTTAARERRYHEICRVVGLQPSHQVLDVGCGNGKSFETFNHENAITGLDLESQTTIRQANFRYVQGDATHMDGFGNGQFDVVICVGVLEHIVPAENLRRAALEIQRVGRAYVVVVPHMYTIIEPHTQLPFWQLYPPSLKRFLRRRISTGAYERDATGDVGTLNYLPKSHWAALFPGAHVISYNHVLGGLIRDFMIYKTCEHAEEMRLA